MSSDQIGAGTFMLGDCFERMAEIPDGSVDMVLADLPYGTTQNKWDSVLPLDKLWAAYWRVCKPNAAVVLTASQPFTSLLGASQIQHLRYAWVWEKSNATGHLNAKRMPMKLHEDILVFYKHKPSYDPQGTVTCNKQGRRGGNGECYGKSGLTNTQTLENYPRTILRYPYDSVRGLHPTQKPIALFEYLIRTYTNEGDLVLDNTAGSGTTAVAAERSDRRWCCIERDEVYYAKAVERVKEHVASPR